MSLMFTRIGAVVVGLGVGACSNAASVADSSQAARSSQQAVTGSCATPVVVAQSLFVASVDGQGNANPFGVAALANFSFQNVMQQIMTTGAPGSSQTALDLYQQLVGTLEKPPCTGTINGFPVDCPRPEGALATTNPFTGTNGQDIMIPVALVNRFDLAPNNGDNCGQYRIVFAITPSNLTPPVKRFLMIFEAVLPNPDPPRKLKGCLPVAQFWDSLSAPGITTSDFAAQLQAFYFTGLAAPDGGSSFSPVISAQNYGFGFPANGNTGQIRVNMLSSPTAQAPDGQWQLRQFELSQNCPDGGACTLVAANSFVGNNPFGGLFAAGDAGVPAFQGKFTSQVKNLAKSTIPLISMTTPSKDNAGQSSEQDDTNDYAFNAGLGLSAGSPVNPLPPPNVSLSSAIQAELDELDSGLTPLNILDRATTQSCAGCHRLSPNTDLGGGLTWPLSEGFTQVNESGGQSQALTNAFLPFRSDVLTSFIDKHCGKDAGADDGDGTQTVGGGAAGASN